MAVSVGSRGFFEYVGDDIIKAPIQNFTDQFSSNLIPTITPILIVGLTLYFVLKGYLAMTGRSQDPIMEILIHGFKVALIAYIFLNTGNFINYSWDFLDASEHMILNAMPGTPDSSWNAIDKLWVELFKIEEKYYECIKHFSLGKMIVMGLLGVIFVLASLFLTCSAFGVLLITTISLAVVCGFGPLFAGFLFFPLTKSWFDGWLKVCLGLAFTKILFSAFLMLVCSVVNGMLPTWSSVNQSAGDSWMPLLENFLTLVIVIVSAASLISKIPQISSSMVGGAQLAFSGSSSAMGSFAGAMNRAGSTMAAGKLMGGIGKEAMGAAGSSLTSASGIAKLATGVATGGASFAAQIGMAALKGGMQNRINRSLQQIGSK